MNNSCWKHWMYDILLFCKQNQLVNYTKDMQMQRLDWVQCGFFSRIVLTYLKIHWPKCNMWRRSVLGSLWKVCHQWKAYLMLPHVATNITSYHLIWEFWPWYDILELGQYLVNCAFWVVHSLGQNPILKSENLIGWKQMGTCMLEYIT